MSSIRLLWLAALTLGLGAVFLLSWFNPFGAEAQITSWLRLNAYADWEGIHSSWEVSDSLYSYNYTILVSEASDIELTEETADNSIQVGFGQSYMWPVHDGKIYNLRVCARESGNNDCVYSNIVTVTAWQDWQIEFNRLTEGQEISGIQTVTAVCNFIPENVEFEISQDQDLIGSFDGVAAESGYNYSFDWNTDNGQYHNGNYTITVYAYYNGDIAVMENLGVAVANEPRDLGLVLVSPQSGDVLSGQVSFEARTNTNNASVDFSVLDGSGRIVASDFTVYTDGLSYFSDWDTRSVANGTYTIQAEAALSNYPNSLSEIQASVSNETVSEYVEIISPSTGESLTGVVVLEAEAGPGANTLEFHLIQEGQTERTITANSDADSDYFSAEWDTSGLANTNYYIEAEAYFDSGTMTDGVSVSTSNSSASGYEAVSDLSITFKNTESIVSDIVVLEAETNTDARVTFYIEKENSRIAAYQGAEEEPGIYSYVWDTTVLEDGIYTIRTVASRDGYSQAEDQARLEVANTEPADPTEDLKEPKISITSSFDIINEPSVMLQAQANFVPDSMSFNISGPKEAGYSGTDGGSGSFYHNWRLAEEGFPYGDYLIEAAAEWEGQVYSDVIEVSYSQDPLTAGEIKEEDYDEAHKANEQTVSGFEIAWTEDLPDTVSGRLVLGVRSSDQLDQVVLTIREWGSQTEISHQMLSSTPYHYYYQWDSEKKPNGRYEIEVEARKGEDLRVITRSLDVFNTQVQSSDKTAVNTEPEPEQEPESETLLDPECREKQINDIEACQEFIKLPSECKANNIITQSACERLLEKMAVCNQAGVVVLDKCLEYLSLPAECQRAGRKSKEACQEYMKLDPYCQKNELTHSECRRVMMLPEVCRAEFIWEPEACREYVYAREVPELCQELGAGSNEECRDLLKERGSLSPECLDAGATSILECRSYLQAADLPQPCQEERLDSKEECAAWIRGKVFSEKELGKLWDVCRDAGISQEADCRDYWANRYLPEPCREAGITNIEACTRNMFEYFSADNILLTGEYPVLCRLEGVAAKKECQNFMLSVYLPVECRKTGMTSQEACKQYLEIKHINNECREAGIDTNPECNDFLFDKYAPEQCEEVGITDSQACQAMMFNRYGVRADCEGLNRWQCLEAVEKNYLGHIAAKQKQYNDLDRAVNSRATSSWQISDLARELGSSRGILPFKDEQISVWAAKSRAEIRVKKNQEIVQTSPVVMVVDRDRDGLPDSVEARIGTDPENKDTDGDGYSDYVELQNGYDPAGPGKLAPDSGLAPAEEALIQNAGLEHAKTNGRLDELFAVKRIDNRGQTETAALSGYIRSGQAVPGAVVTLYVYSDLPVVATVKTDKYGNWEYEFQEALMDGEHEVYVALNDNTGRVVAKSDPFQFFIKEAQAVSAGDFIAVANSSRSERTQSYLQFYMIIASLVVAGGILLFVVFWNMYKNTRHLDG
jgi:hypothetical protein